MIRRRLGLLLLPGTCVAGSHPLHSQPPESPPLQWQPAVGPFNGDARALAESDSGTLFAYVGWEMFRSLECGTLGRIGVTTVLVPIGVLQVSAISRTR